MEKKLPKVLISDKLSESSIDIFKKQIISLVSLMTLNHTVAVVTLNHKSYSRGLSNCCPACEILLDKQTNSILKLVNLSFGLVN